WWRTIFRFIDLQPTSVDLFVVQRIDRLVRRRVFHFDETEAARTAGIAIGDDRGRTNVAVGREQLLEVTIRGAPRQISNVDLLHSITPRPDDPDLTTCFGSRSTLPSTGLVLNRYDRGRDDASKPKMTDLNVKV